MTQWQKHVLALWMMFACLVGSGLTALAAIRGAPKPVTKGIILRGSSASTGGPCDFSDEALDASGSLLGASVTCLPGVTDVATALGQLPGRFTSYCSLTLEGASGPVQVTPSPLPGNAAHCSLLGLTPKQAAQSFSSARPR